MAVADRQRDVGESRGAIAESPVVGDRAGGGDSMSAHVDLSPLEPDPWAAHANDDARTTVVKILHRSGGVVPIDEIGRQLARIGRSQIVHADVLAEIAAAGDCFATPTGWTISKELADAEGTQGVGDTRPTGRADLRLVAAAGHDVPAPASSSSASSRAGAPSRHTAADRDTIARHLRERGPCSQQALGAATGLARHSVVKCLRDLEEAGAARRTGQNARDWPDAPTLGRGSPVWKIEAIDDPDDATRRPPLDVPTAAAAAAVSDSTDPTDQDVGEKLLGALRDLGVDAHITERFVGPHVTRWELALADGSALRKVRRLAEELAYALAATEIRIIAPIPGKQAIGIEIPNATRSLVLLRDIAAPRPAGQSPLSVWLGRDVTGAAINVDLATMPHVLVAGTTGAGKSGGLHAMICSILMSASPEEARLLLIDTKRVEFNRYERVGHLLRPVVFDEFDAVDALTDLVGIMEDRYKRMGRAQARGLRELNEACIAAGEDPLPHILCVVDEFADLMALSAGEVEDAVVRLAQKARAVGIHLVLATQTPRVTVITGVIKANIPARVAFAVASKLDSRVILDRNGAESLLGAGDLLFSGIGSSHPLRIQGSYIDGAAIDALTRPLRHEPPDELPRSQGAFVDGEHRDEDDAASQAPMLPETPIDANDADPDLSSTPDDDRDLTSVTGAVLCDESVVPGETHAQTVARATEVAAPVRALIARTGGQLSDALEVEGLDVLAESAVAILVGRYTAALLSSIEQGDRDPSLLDRFERLLGVI